MFPYDTKNKDIIDETIKKTTKKKKWIVHGAHAVNKQLPTEYHRPTRDWDLFSKTPKQSSIYLESEIEKAINEDAFEQSEIPLTNSNQMVYRIISKATGEEVADFMKTPSYKNLYKKISGIRWETLEHAKMTYRKILSNPVYQQRWDKARGDLQRIEAFESSLSKKSKTIKKSEIPSPFIIIKIKPIMLRH